jgi:hypothetical protein
MDAVVTVASIVAVVAVVAVVGGDSVAVDSVVASQIAWLLGLIPLGD